jgi:hypothetical protein
VQGRCYSSRTPSSFVVLGSCSSLKLSNQLSRRSGTSCSGGNSPSSLLPIAFRAAFRSIRGSSFWSNIDVNDLKHRPFLPTQSLRAMGAWAEAMQSRTRLGGIGGMGAGFVSSTQRTRSRSLSARKKQCPAFVDGLPVALKIARHVFSLSWQATGSVLDNGPLNRGQRQHSNTQRTAATAQSCPLASSGIKSQCRTKSLMIWRSGSRIPDVASSASFFRHHLSRQVFPVHFAASHDRRAVDLDGNPVLKSSLPWRVNCAMRFPGFTPRRLPC